MPQIPFVGASYRARSTNLDAQACINLFPVIGESGTAKSVRALYGTPGMRPLVSGATGVVRGVHAPTNAGPAIVVIGNNVYRLSTSFVLTAIGSIDALDTPVKIDDNGLQAVIVTGVNGYTVDLNTNVVAQIVDPAFYGAYNVDFLFTYAIFNRPGTNQFYISGSNTITFDALDFASAESNYEPIVNFIVNHDEILFFKQTATEIWRISSNPDFPFARDTNAAIEQGCAARDSVAALDNSVFWVGRNADGDGIIWRMNGYTPTRVSTDAIEYALASYSTIEDAVAYTYQQEGHSFYVVSFPSGNTTWVFDAATNLWHQRGYTDPATGKMGRHRSNCHTFFNGQHIVGDYQNGDLSTLDLDYYMDGTDPLIAIRAASYVASSDYNFVSHNTLQVDMETGVGLTSGQGSDPKAWLDWSDDGGKSWSNQHFRSLGKIGKYRTRVRWNRLGRSRARVYRLTISDPVKRVILGAVLNP
jgi:hypothetical protein